MTAYIPYNSWAAVILAHQWIQCGQLLPFPPGCMIPLLGALARLNVRLN